MYEVLEDILPRVGEDEIEHDVNFNSIPSEGGAKKVSKLLNYVLLPQSMNMPALSFIVKLLHAKMNSQMSNMTVSIILGLLRKAFPTSTIPRSYYNAS